MDASASAPVSSYSAGQTHLEARFGALAEYLATSLSGSPRRVDKSPCRSWRSQDGRSRRQRLSARITTVGGSAEPLKDRIPISVESRARRERRGGPARHPHRLRYEVEFSEPRMLHLCDTPAAHNLLLRERLLEVQNGSCGDPNRTRRLNDLGHRASPRPALNRGSNLFLVPCARVVGGEARIPRHLWVPDQFGQSGKAGLIGDRQHHHPVAGQVGIERS